MKYRYWCISGLILLIFVISGSATLETTANHPSLPSSGTIDETKPIVDDKVPAKPDIVIRASRDIFYGIAKDDGFLFSGDSGKTWERRNVGLPTKLTYPFLKEKVRNLTALGVDAANPGRVAALTATNIYLSEDQGLSWSQIPRNKPIPEGAYLTAVTLSPANQDTILLGTSFAGIFETTNRGKNWVNISKNLRFLYQGADYWQEIAGLAYQKEEPNQILFACGFGQGVYKLSQDRKSAERLNFAGLINEQFLNALPIQSNTPGFTDHLKGNHHLLPESIQSEPLWLDACITDQLFKNQSYRSEVPEDPAKIDRLRTAAHKYGIYLRSDMAKGKSLDQKIDFLRKNGLNAMVIDFKDDFGNITYNTKLAWPLKMGAVRKNGIQIEELLRKAKENQIYIIGRIVVFQDPQLFRFQNYKYAAWDKYSNKPWNTKEYWVDPFSKDVWEYEVAIAEELQNIGIDEIQFDYIRFPTDGDIGRITYRFRPEKSEKIDALESFLAFARERIKIPISTDLYGFNCWCRAVSLTGQNIELLADYIDVICPMYYPSHFPRGFLPDLNYLERAKQIYYLGTQRAHSIVEGRSIIRPYVQAFRLGGERKMTAPVYTDYLLNQIQGNLATASPGFTLWDFSNRYYMVTKPLDEVIKSFENRELRIEN